MVLFPIAVYTALAMVVPPSPIIIPNDTCETTCHCESDIMNCDGIIPMSVPPRIKRIVLSEIDSRDFYPGRFCAILWGHLQSVAIESVNSDSAYFHLDGGVFSCLDFIQSFKFQSPFLLHFSHDTFSGLGNVTDFDLSGCQAIIWEDIFNMLSVHEYLPKLTNLSLSGTGLYERLNLDQKYIDILAQRPIIYLDLSYTNFQLDFDNASNICETLTVFIYSGAEMTYTNKFMKCGTCDSLNTLYDNDDKNLRNDFRNIKCINSRLKLQLKPTFYKSMQTLYMNKIVIPSTKVSLKNCTIILLPDTAINSLHFANNYLPHFDAALVNNRLRYIDLSNNAMESIGSRTFRYLPYLETAVLSNNSFYRMETYDDTFLSLFKHNEALKLVDLSHNKLTYLPNNTFARNTYINELRMAGNDFQQIALNISHIGDLRRLDLRGNRIKYLDESSQRLLEILFQNQQDKNHTFEILLEGNPFSCECQYYNFLQWFVHSPVFLQTRTDEIFCYLSGKRIPISSLATEAADQDCARLRRQRLVIILSSTLPTIGLAALIITTVILIKRRKKRQQRRRFETAIRRLRADTSLFPMFLSYSSDDSDFVKTHMLRQFQVQYQFELFTICKNKLFIAFSITVSVQNFTSFLFICAHLFAK